MQAALDAASAASGSTWPNPAVGCVLVDPQAQTIVATGASQKGGRPHAEMDALSKAGPRVRGCHAYVTLEPCNHTSPGKPCSCAHGLIEAGAAAVIVAMPDPDARMMGKSIAMFRDAGIPVHVGLMADAAFHTHRAHAMRTLRGRPWVTLKLAHSKDGFLGLPGQRTAISGGDSWAGVHAWRAGVDAVMIGAGTALTDDPQLTSRIPGPANQPARQPVRVVLDGRARLTPQSKLAQDAQEHPVWVLTRHPRPDLESLGVGVLDIGTGIHDALQVLHDNGLTHILCEGGATLAQSLINAKLVDEALMIEGDVTLGGEAIPCPALEGMTLRETRAAGADTWRMFDSQDALDLRRDFFALVRPACDQA